ncbi:MAG: lactonase family protein [Lentisphaeraceae bacterium]|nr:lactonase family protein [Lentisphaeraceae bacterium]
MKTFFIVIFSLLFVAGYAEQKSVYIGTHSDTNSKGLYKVQLNSETGDIGDMKLVLEEFGTSIVSSKINGSFLYTCGNDEKGGVLSIFDTVTGKQVFSGNTAGEGPCYIELSNDRQYLFIANIQSGSVSSYKIGDNGSSLTYIDQFKLPESIKFRPHAAKLSPDNRFLLVPAINLNTIYVLRNNLGKLKLAHQYKREDFKGPRHITFSNDGKFSYLVNQTGESVSSFNYLSKTGELVFIENVQALESQYLQINNHISEIKVHPNNRFVYVANRGHDSIALLYRNPDSGRLEFQKTYSSKGNAPWSFDLTENGKFLICSNGKSGTLHSFEIDLETGELIDLEKTLKIGKRLSSVRIFDRE